MSLRWRIALLLAAVAVAVGVFCAIAFAVTTADRLRSSIDDSLRNTATVVNGDGRQPDGGHGRGDGDGDCPLAAEFPSAAAAQIVATDGTVAACISGAPQIPVSADQRALTGSQVDLRTVDVDGHGYRVLSTPWHDGGLLQIARSTTESTDLLHALVVRLAVLVAVATAVAAAVGWFVATRLTRPIVRLRDSAHRIATTLDLDTPVVATGPGEVGSLGTSFSTMVGAVAQSQEQQRRLVADASHEMRTPLTSLRSNVELLGRIEQLDATERRAVVDDVVEDVDELAALLAELVDLASDLRAAEPESDVDLGDLARTVAARTTRRTGRAVAVEETATSPLRGRPRQLERAIANLVDNAVKYGPADATVAVRVDGVRVTVVDEGDGIVAEDLAHVFDRFYRAAAARTRPGSGLGLSIVDEIVRSHGGTVFARRRTDRSGSEVGFDLSRP